MNTLCKSVLNFFIRFGKEYNASDGDGTEVVFSIGPVFSLLLWEGRYDGSWHVTVFFLRSHIIHEWRGDNN